MSDTTANEVEPQVQPVKHPTSDSKSARRPRRGAGALGVFAALALTVVLHGLIVTAFRSPAKVVVPPRQLKQDPDSVLLSATGNGYDWESELRAWSRIADPTIMSLPSERFGFSQVRANERVLPLAPMQDYVFSARMLAEPAFKTPALALPSLALPQQLSKTWSVADIPVPDAPPVSEVPRQLFWRRPGGKPLRALPVPSARRVRDLLQEEMPDAPTRVEIATAAGVHRIRVRQASGNAALDRLAVQTLIPLVRTPSTSPYAEAEKGAPRIQAILPAFRGELVAEIEWRLALPRDVEG